MNIEDRIREIVREELDKREKPLVPKYEPRNWEDVRVGMMEKCPTCGRKDFLTCANTHCFMRPPVVRYGAAPAYNPPGIGLVQLDENVPSGTAVIVNVTKELSVSRTGCACPPGTVASCPDKACPWKS